MKSMEVHEELEAVQKIYDLLQPLKHKARSRVMDWVIDKLEEERNEALTAPTGGPPGR